MAEADPRAALVAWDMAQAEVTPVSIGLINVTFRVDHAGASYALQRLHPVFRGEVNDDIDAITRHLESKGLLTPRIVPTTSGATWLAADDGPWRMLTWLAGESVHTTQSLDRFRSAGALVARFHLALTDLEHEFAFTRPGAHDTPRHLQRLEQALETHRAHRRSDVLRPLAEAILDHSLPKLPELPLRIIHGDLKLSNVLFRGDEAVTLVDLDTLQHGTLAIELGDALRSWCNPAGEDVDEATVNLDIFDAAMAGYLGEAADWITSDEIDAIVPGFETITLELASRFCLDAFEEAYFRWDSRFESASHHNEIRARGQLSYARSIAGSQKALRSRLGRE